MKPIKCWVAQDGSQSQCSYLYTNKPTLVKKPNYQYYYGGDIYLGKDILGKRKCIECVVITKEEYERLKQNDKS